MTLIVEGDRVRLNSRGLLLLNEAYIEIHVVVHRSIGARPGIRRFVVVKHQTTLGVEVVNLVARLRRRGILVELVSYLLALLSWNPQELYACLIVNFELAPVISLGCALGSRLLDLCSNSGYRRRAKHHAQAQTGRDSSVKLPIHVVVLSRLASPRPLRERRHLNCMVYSSRENPKKVAQPSYI